MPLQVGANLLMKIIFNSNIEICLKFCSHYVNWVANPEPQSPDSDDKPLFS